MKETQFSFHFILLPSAFILELRPPSRSGFRQCRPRFMPAPVRVIFVTSTAACENICAHACGKWNRHGERRRRERARERLGGRRNGRAARESGGGLWQPRD